MKYTPHTRIDIEDMLKTIGVPAVEDLFRDIPADMRAAGYGLGAGKSEYEVLGHLKHTAGRNRPLRLNLTGGGFYDHYIPSAVDRLAGRAEFYTAYTPYQPECSQGTLQAIFEYQTAICRITGMDVSNASVYDGGTALAEGILMAMRVTGRNKIVIDKSVNPIYRDMIRTYLGSQECELAEVGPDGLALDMKGFSENIGRDTAAAVVQNPNFFGTINDYSEISAGCRKAGALTICSVYPLSLGLLRTPGEMGADIVTGEGQSLGNPLSFGGPYLGFMAVKREYIRQLPGRIVGETVDRNGKKCYVLTLQAREQHIKRHRATSNICTNQSLCALRALLYLSCLGEKGFRDTAVRNYTLANYAVRVLSDIEGVEFVNGKPVFNEFVLRFKDKADVVYSKLLARGISAGIPLGGYYKGMDDMMLMCVTEKLGKDDISMLRKELEEL
ncbi:MAG: aminomethyl-transferring glycine dehydrogenase subunit GcvPA [Elusimicrobia bacterium]|nr:aminomethyl-transferring glycine dehydrogenase subunit GcvPA [Elusimicrobiota bacterium]